MSSTMITKKRSRLSNLFFGRRRRSRSSSTTVPETTVSKNNPYVKGGGGGIIPPSTPSAPILEVDIAKSSPGGTISVMSAGTNSHLDTSGDAGRIYPSVTKLRPLLPRTFEHDDDDDENSTNHDQVMRAILYDHDDDNNTIITNGSNIIRSLQNVQRGGGTGSSKTKKLQQQMQKQIQTQTREEQQRELRRLHLQAQQQQFGQKSAAALQRKKIMKARKNASFLARSKQFRKLSDYAYDIVDADKSGGVDKKEMYSGLLLIHLELASYAGPAACKTVSREQVEKLFDKMDADQSGTLDKDEFHDVMILLCSQVFTRVMIQWSMTIMIVPLIAQFFIDGFIAAILLAWNWWSNVEQLDPMRQWISNQYDLISGLIPSIVSDFVVERVLLSGWSFMKVYLDMIPESILTSVPLTLVSCILGVIVVPYLLFKVDDFFSSMAEKTAEEKKLEKEKFS